MATIKSQMVLNDGVSRVLSKIVSGLDMTLGAFERVQQASASAVDVATIEAARGALVDASNAVDEMAENFRRAAQEEERLNQGIHEGTSALDGMVTKVVSLVGAYMSLSAIKGFATSSMDAANTQINAQRQLRTVLNNMGAEESYQALVDETSGNILEDALTLNTAEAVSDYEALVNMADGAELENTLTLGTSEAVSSYTGLASGVDGVELENTLALDTSGAQTSYNAFATGVDGNVVTLAVQADAAQATSAYDAILAKAAEIQGNGVYGDEIMIAGAAELATYFEDANAVMSMMDTLTDYAMGMSALDGNGLDLDSASMVQYATNLGKVMTGTYTAMSQKGFEFTDTQKAIIEGTATEAQIVAGLGEEYLGMSQDMQAAAAINAVIAEGWGGLYETMSDTPEGKILQLNHALGDIKENVGAGIYPAVVNFVNVFQQNLPQIEGMAMGLATALGFVINFLTGMVEGAMAFGSAVADNWSWIEPIVWGVVAALGAYGAVLLAVNGIQIVNNAMEAASNGIKAISAAHSAMKAGASLAEAAATTTATGAQVGLNAALLACPITWIVVAVIGLIAAFYAAVAAINHFAGTSVSATGIIAEAFAVLGAHIINTFIVPVWNFFASIANFIGNVFNDPVAAVQVLFYDLALTVVGYISNMAHAIENVINKIPGVTVDITSGLDNFYSGLEQAQQAVKDESGWVEYVQKMDFIDYGDAASAGYEFGQGVEDKIGGFFNGFSYEPGSIEDYANAGIGIDSFTMDDLSSDVGDIANNTGGMADALEVSGEELKYLRDIAERDAINRFTTAEVKIDMTGMTNKIDSSMDLDGVIRELTDGFSEALVTAAEGVHE